MDVNFLQGDKFSSNLSRATPSQNGTTMKYVKTGSTLLATNLM